MTSAMKSNFHLLAIAAVAALSAGCGNGQENNGAFVPVSVRAVSVEETVGINTKSYVGTATPVRSAVLSASYSGTVVSLPARQGTFFRRGDVLAVIESQSVVSMYESAMATLEQAEDGYRRAEQVYGTGSIAEVKMVEIRTQVAKARAAAAAAKKALEDCTIRAPFDGTVSEVVAEEGVDVTIGQPLVRLFDVSSLEICFSVPENEIGGISVGDRAEFNVPALGHGADSSAWYASEVIMKGISGSSLSHSYECRLGPDEENPGLMPGMVCKVRMMRMQRSGVVIPADIVRGDCGGKYVWGVDSTGTVEKIRIATGGFSGKGIIVVSGLEPGDRVITEGVQKVCSGMKVRVIG